MRRDPQAARISAADWLDRATIGASLLCLVHCTALPLLLAVIPALSRFIAMPRGLHIWLLAFALPSSALALIAGHRGHRAFEPLALAVPVWF